MKNATLLAATLALVASPVLVQAAPLWSVDFQVTIDSTDPLGGQTFSGSATYDPSSITGVDIERVELFTFDFLYDSVTYDVSDDTEVGWPAAYFYNGVFEGIEFRGYSPANPDVTQVELLASIGPDLFRERSGQIVDLGFIPPFFNPTGTVNGGDVTFGVPVAVSVPEPATALMIAGGGLALMIRRRRRQA